MIVQKHCIPTRKDSALCKAFSQTVQCLLPRIDRFLANANHSNTDLHTLCHGLPAILQGGFECRLSANANRVDIHQCVQHESCEQKTLSAFLEDADALSPEWRRLRDFCNKWTHPPSPLYRGIHEIWLEYDAAASRLRPNLFIGFAENLTNAEIFEVIENALCLLLDNVAINALNQLRDCISRCEAGERISYIGVMLGRPKQILRVNVRGLSGKRMATYLKSIGWTGPAQALCFLNDPFISNVERTILCLDVGVQLLPTLGIECAFSRQPPEEAKWISLLDALVKRNLCIPAKRDLMLAWPGCLTPLQAQLPWPEFIVISSLVKKTAGCSMFRMRLNHIKISFGPQGTPSAKGYLWFDHAWRFLGMDANKIDK